MSFPAAVTREKKRFFVVSCLLLVSCLLTFYFHVRLHSETVFTHFFYVPIAVSVLWWGRKGLIISLFLAALLVVSHVLYRQTGYTPDDFLRVVMFIFVALVFLLMKERIDKTEKALRNHRRELETVVAERTRELSSTIAKLEESIELRRRVECERARLIADLQKTLAKVRTLSGLLPICANCKRIRDDSGYWQQIEAYLREHSVAEFSHSICPECSRALYPQLYEEKCVETEG